MVWVVVAMVVLGVFGLAGARRLWRGAPVPYGDARNPWTAGWWRAVPVTSVGALTWFLVVLAGAFVVREPGEPPAWWVVLMFGVLAVTTAVGASIVLFNLPKFLVPPHRRGETGAWSAWRSK